MKIKGQLFFKSDKQTSFVSKQIAQFANRSDATANHIKTVLSDLKEQLDINTLKGLDEGVIKEYIENLQERLTEGEISSITTANYISALNRIIDYTNHFTDKNLQNISVEEHGLSKGHIELVDRSNSIEQREQFKEYLQEKYQETGDIRFKNLKLATKLQESFGLRARESWGTRLETLEKGLETGKIQLTKEDHTKNGRPREISIRTEEQREVVKEVINHLKDIGQKSLAGPENRTTEVRQFGHFAHREAHYQGFNFHANRHAWAQETYSQLWQERVGVRIEAPIKVQDWQEHAQEKISEAFIIPDMQADKQAEHDHSQLFEMPDIFEIDKEIRMEISAELGHNRLDVTNVYLGKS